MSKFKKEGYFGKKEEIAVIRFLSSDDEREKNDLFLNSLCVRIVIKLVSPSSSNKSKPFNVLGFDKSISILSLPKYYQIICVVLLYKQFSFDHKILYQH